MNTSASTDMMCIVRQIFKSTEGQDTFEEDVMRS